jgi:phosphoadenosine phosphosulfate reductase
MLKEQTLFGEIDKVQQAIDRLKQYEPEEGYYLAFSGGKDSVCIKALADMAGVKYDAHYNITTVDPPELVKFIKRYHPDVIRERPTTNMWKMIVAHGTPPTRIMRYCCQELKEGGGKGRVVVTGIRAAESGRRAKKRKIWETPQCGMKGGSKYVLNPIFDWKNGDVWDFIKKNNLPYCNLYDKGRERLGCILCPLSKLSEKEKDILEYPHITNRYKKALKDAMDRNSERGKVYKITFLTEGDLFTWWVRTPPKYDFETYGLFD